MEINNELLINVLFGVTTILGGFFFIIFGVGLALKFLSFLGIVSALASMILIGLGIFCFASFVVFLKEIIYGDDAK